ncbi:hypothetical protein C0Q70_13101 [Pomacea canaliculata]|uniref:BZIP domain-containing protein n=1 Tax=Pomacea canaliculata TaxID=400727 RepID=A0A2T7NW98_POMCA|nr:hypothetical protein C0Q70_13101 [Pomacea canaliculata]
MWAEDECDLDFMSDAEIDGLVDDTSLSSYLSGEFKDLSTTSRAGRATQPRSPQQRSPYLNGNDILIVDDIQEDIQPKTVFFVRQADRSSTLAEGQRVECRTKNAIAARENRLKKKKYLTELEESVRELRIENSHLKKRDEEKTKTIAKLEKEVQYLKNVLANQSVLSTLLQSINSIPGVKFGNSLSVHSDENQRLPVLNRTLASKGKLPVQSFVSTRARSKRDNETLSAIPHFGDQSRTVSGNEAARSSVQQQSFTGNILIGAETVAHSKNFAEKEVIDVCSLNEDENSSIFSGISSPLKGGVCLHVSGQSVSLEFCRSCNESSVQSFSSDHNYYRPDVNA